MTYKEARDEIIENGVVLGAGDYVDLEALKVAADACDRLTPKKPTYVDTRFRNHGRYVSDGCSLAACYKCPNCRSHIFHVFDSERFCVHCGQALDWGEEDTNA